MATAKSFLFLLLSILLLIEILSNFTPLTEQYFNFRSPGQVYTKVVLNLGDTQRLANRKALPPFPPPALINENDMVALTDKNFISFIENNRNVMVIFYTSEWRAAPEHATLCKQLTGASVVAKVDFNEVKTLAARYEIERYPSIFFFPGGTTLRDYFYSEVLLEVEARKRVEGKSRGKFVKRSKVFTGLVEPRKNKHWDGIRMVEEEIGTRQRGSIIERVESVVNAEDKVTSGEIGDESIASLNSWLPAEVVEPRKNENVTQSYFKEDAKWNMESSVHEDVLRGEADQMTESSAFTIEAS